MYIKKRNLCEYANMHFAIFRILQIVFSLHLQMFMHNFT